LARGQQFAPSLPADTKVNASTMRFVGRDG
jgi:hypothetical protein